MTWKIDMGLYKVLTDSNVPEILKYGRTAANFICVTDTNGRRLMLNVRSIVSVEENGTSAPSDTLVGGIIDSLFGAPKVSEPDMGETIVVDEEEEE